MDLSREFGTDSEKELGGVWCRITKDSEALIARSNNKNFREYNRNATRPFIRRGRLRISDSEMDAITEENIAKTVFLSIRGEWKDENDKGKLADVKDTPDERLRILRKYPELMETVLSFANDFELYREERVEETAGN